MFPDRWYAEPTSSENQPIPPVSVDPDAQPLVPLQVNAEYLPYLFGMLEQGMLQGAYAEDISADDLALVQQRWLQLRSLWARSSVENVRPFYEDASDVDNNDPQVDIKWYENVGDWILEGFLAVTVSPGAAIAYRATIPVIRIATRQSSIGAAFKVLINGAEAFFGDDYS